MDKDKEEEKGAPGKLVKLVAGSDGFGSSLKRELLEHLRAEGIEAEDVGDDKYYAVAERVARRVQQGGGGGDAARTRGLLVCGTGMGVGIFANKYSGVYAAVCENEEAARNARSISDSNVLALGASVTGPERSKSILDAWLRQEFRAPCPASGEKAWEPPLAEFLEKSVDEMARIPALPQGQGQGPSSSPPSSAGGDRARGSTGCTICDIARGRGFADVEAMPGGSWKVLREDPTVAIVRFREGSIEPAHHHTFGHDVHVTSGKKRVYNTTAGGTYDLEAGDYLYTPAGDVHRVVYLADTEFFLRWDGKGDILLDEDVEQARAALRQDESLEIVDSGGLFCNL
eukprot:jgi/Mesen1/7070/ME000369S06394